MLRLSSLTLNVSDPPVAIAKNWIANRTFAPSFPLIDVSQAVPGIAPAAMLRSKMRELAGDPTSARYAPALGLMETRAAIASSLAQHHVSIDNVMVTAGCNQAFCLAIGALCDPGDEVIVPVPWYFNHKMWLDASGVRAVGLPTAPEHGMLADVAQCESLITPATRAIVLVTPNNPCGVEYPPDLIRLFFDLARNHNLALILDETYKDFRSATAPAHSLFSIPTWETTLVHLFSFSKVFSMAGYRVGSLTAAPHVLRSAVKLADCQTIAASTLSQRAVAYALEHLNDWVGERRVEMLHRLDAFRIAMAAAPAFETVSSGAFFAYVRHPSSDSGEAVARRLADDHNVLCIPGSSFGPDQEQFLRLAFGNIADDAMNELATRLHHFSSTAP